MLKTIPMSLDRKAKTISRFLTTRFAESYFLFIMIYFMKQIDEVIHEQSNEDEGQCDLYNYKLFAEISNGHDIAISHRRCSHKAEINSIHSRFDWNAEKAIVKRSEMPIDQRKLKYDFKKIQEKK